MQPELEAMVQRYGLQEQVRFAGVWQEMPALYGELDALVSCSYTEAMPLALMEAMACGLPAVATRVGGVPDIVEHGHTGWWRRTTSTRSAAAAPSCWPTRPCTGAWATVPGSAPCSAWTWRPASSAWAP